MLKKRIIPILLIKNGSIVKTVKFQNPRIVGDVRSTVQIFKNRLHRLEIHRQKRLLTK